MFNNSIDISKFYIEYYIKKGDIVVDGTVGNGNDTLTLKRAVGNEGKVLGFDIQQVALDNTRALLKEHGEEQKVLLYKASHHEMDIYVKEPIKAAVFNLGYLPKGDHKIATKPEITIVAIEKALSLITDDGFVSVMIYHGGDTGFHERDILMDYLKRLDCKVYNVLMHNYINKPNNPPILVVISKKK